MELFITFCMQNNIVLAYLFGSQANTGYRILTGEKVTNGDPLTDLDLGIVLGDSNLLNGSMYKLFTHLYNQIDELFLPLRLDLVFLQETHSVFQFEAIKGICIYFKSEEFKDEYEHNILAKAADFRWVLEQYYRERLEDIEVTYGK